MKKIIPLYIYTAGVLLLALASALIVTNLTTRIPDLIPIRDPIFNLTLSSLFWILGGALAVVSLFCLCGRNTKLQLALLLWFSLNTLLGYLSLPLMNVKGINGHLGPMSQAFNLSAPTITAWLMIALIYLLLGSAISIGYLLTRSNTKQQ